MKLKNITKALILLFLFSSISCSSDKDSENSTSNDNSNSKLIIGKWAWTNQTLPSKCASYREFKSDGTLTYYQRVCETPEIDYLVYKIDGNILSTKNATTGIKGENNETETIIELTATTMKTSFKSGAQMPIQYVSYVKIE